MKKLIKRYKDKVIDKTSDVLANVVYQKPAYDTLASIRNKNADDMLMKKAKNKYNQKNNPFNRY